MNNRKLSSSPFKTCMNGHETIYEDQLMYDNQKKRVCRQCAEANKTGRKRAKL